MPDIKEAVLSRIICALHEQESISDGADLREMAEHIYDCVCTDGYRFAHITHSVRKPLAIEDC